MKLRHLGEDRLLDLLLPGLPKYKGVLAGAGDDCAAVEPPIGNKQLLLKTDCVVEKVHFTSRTKPEEIGWKAMMRPLSDFAATSGIPQYALVTLVASSATEVNWVKRLYSGLNRAARKFNVAVVGGETSRTRGPAMLSVSVAGYVETKRRMTRKGGRAGDDLYVTGMLGGSIRGKHLRFTPRIVESRWLTENFSIHAMMDLSDGLGADLPRLAKASGLGFELDEDKIPRSEGVSTRHAISDGEDYELLFAVSPRDSARLQRAWRRKFPKVRLTHIGRLTPKSKIPARNASHSDAGRRNRISLRGYVHFK